MEPVPVRKFHGRDGDGRRRPDDMAYCMTYVDYKCRGVLLRECDSEILKEGRAADLR